MEQSIIVGLDIGTSGVRAVAYTLEGDQLAEGRSPLRTSYRENDPAIAEQDPADWWQSSVQALQILAGRLEARIDRVKAVGLTGQCPTFALLDRSGSPIGPGILYQDNRAVAQTESMIRLYGKSTIHQRSGQAASPFYIAPKLLWLKEQGGLSVTAESTVVQPRDYVGWQMTGKLATDPTHAACTLLYDLRRYGWSDDWIADLGLQIFRWPDILDPDSVLGHLSKQAASITGFPEGVPVVVGAADSLCAAYGARMAGSGELCDVTGTSTCLHLLVKEPVDAYDVNTYPYMNRGEWCAEVGLNTTGEALRWLSRTVNAPIEQLLEQAAEVAPGCGGLAFLPHLSGERDAPGRPGAFIGLHLGHTQAHLARAVLEGVAFAMRERVELLRTAGCPVSGIVSCGGGSRNALWNQIKTNVIGLPLRSVSPADTTAIGAALLGAKGAGMEAADIQMRSTSYSPAKEHDYESNYKHFRDWERLMLRS